MTNCASLVNSLTTNSSFLLFTPPFPCLLSNQSVCFSSSITTSFSSFSSFASSSSSSPSCMYSSSCSYLSLTALTNSFCFPPSITTSFSSSAASSSSSFSSSSSSSCSCSSSSSASTYACMLVMMKFPMDVSTACLGPWMSPGNGIDRISSASDP